MSTTRRKEASRANGARSKGPNTPEGKARSSRNAVKHGLLAGLVVVSPECREAFEELLAANTRALRPANYVEQDLVEQMTAASWRMRRIWAIECRHLEKEIQATRCDGDNLDLLTEAHIAASGKSNQLELLDRYERRFHRVYHRSIHSLSLVRDIQANREKKKTDQTNLVPKSNTRETET